MALEAFLPLEGLPLNPECKTFPQIHFYTYHLQNEAAYRRPHGAEGLNLSHNTAKACDENLFHEVWHVALE